MHRLSFITLRAAFMLALVGTAIFTAELGTTRTTAAQPAGAPKTKEPTLVATWEHLAAGAAPIALKLYSNNTFETVIGGGTWVQTGNTLKLTWPKGGWLDTLTISDDGQTYAGRNLNGRMLEGKLLSKARPAKEKEAPVDLKPLIRGRDTENANRVPVPSDAAVAKAELAVRQVLKDEYAKKTPAELRSFAQKLIKLAEETTDNPATRFVMLCDAREFALVAADPALALLAIGNLAKWYQIDGSAQQLASLEKILAATTVTATAKTIAEAATASAQSASDGDELDEAVEFAQLAVNAAKKAKFTTTALDEAEANLAQAKKSRDGFAALRPALEKVKSMPDDPVANLAVGKYRCFIQNRWDDGLKHLAKGEDAAIRVVAELDLNTPRTGALEDAKLADAWWEYAQVAPADLQWGAQTRTRYWYARSIPALTGLNKARAEARLGITVGTVEYRPGLICEFTAPKQPAILKGKKARIDSTIDFSGGEFAEGAKTTDVTARWTGGLAPTRGGRYTLIAQTAEHVRVKIDGKIVIDTTVGGAPKREASVTLGEKMTPIVVEYFGQNADKYKIKLAWVAPGAMTEEVIPAESLFHDRKAESALGK